MGGGVAILAHLRLRERAARDTPGRVPSSCEQAAPSLVSFKLTVGTEAARQRRRVIAQLGPPPALRFLNARSLSELTIGDMRALLAEYQWLSRAYGDCSLPVV